MHAKREGQAKALFSIFQRFIVGQEYIDLYVDRQKTDLCDWLYDRNHAPRGWTRRRRLYAIDVRTAPIRTKSNILIESVAGLD